MLIYEVHEYGTIQVANLARRNMESARTMSVKVKVGPALGSLEDVTV